MKSFWNYTTSMLDHRHSILVVTQSHRLTHTPKNTPRRGHLPNFKKLSDHLTIKLNYISKSEKFISPSDFSKVQINKINFQNKKK